MTASLSPSLAPSDRDARRVRLAIGVLTLLGAGLRIAAARGDLWLDEIWAFDLLRAVRRSADIILALPYDTNHVLVSLWLDLVGPQASSLLARLPAILFGVLTIPSAAWACRRDGRAASLAAATVFAVDYVFVHFGSEARGYAGMILAVVLAYGALEMWIERGGWRSLFVVAGAVAFGMFNHLTMLEPTAALCLAALARLAVTRGPAVLAREGLALFAAALLGVAPALVCFAVSLTSGPLHIGLVTPFTMADFLTGFGRMMRAEVGLPDGPVDLSALAALVAGLTLCVVLALARLPVARRLTPAVLVLGLPALHVLLRLPNQQYPRFHLASAIGLALLAGTVWAEAWRGRASTRWVAAGVALAFGLGQASSLGQFIVAQRGQFARATALLATSEPTRFAVQPAVQAGETAAVIRWYAQHQGDTNPPDLVRQNAACPHDTDWLIIVTLPYQPAPPAQASDACGAPFSGAETFPAYGFSGFRWTLYRRSRAARP